MPSLTDVYLPNAFKYNDVTIVGGVRIVHESSVDIRDLYLRFNSPSYEYCMRVLESSNETTTLSVVNGACPFENVTVFDLSKYPRLKTLRIGNNGFKYVNELNLTGLNELESVVIGRNSFPSASLELRSLCID